MLAETRIVVSDGLHNAFTDLTYWHDHFWLVYVSSPSHFRNSKSCLKVLCSDDAKAWEETATLRIDGTDIRDPKFFVLGDEMLLFAYLNKSFDPNPYQTVVSTSIDGVRWSSFTNAIEGNWLLSRPVQTPTGKWFAAAHRVDLGVASIASSDDGHKWEYFSNISAGGKSRVDETALMCQPNGSLLSVSRLEAGNPIFGGDEAGTLVSLAYPPFSNWQEVLRTNEHRIDSPTLFSLGETAAYYVVGRRQPQISSPFQRQGSALAKKRTSIFHIVLTPGLERAGRLTHIMDLPSAGDTAYAGVVVNNGKVFISYYTNNTQSDPPWLFGMFQPTQIMLAEIDVNTLKDEKEVL